MDDKKTRAAAKSLNAREISIIYGVQSWLISKDCTRRDRAAWYWHWIKHPIVWWKQVRW
jgi:hypothetical protein